MRLPSLVSVALIVSFTFGCGVAEAQVGSDVMAIVFDTEYYSSYDTGDPYVPVSGYLVLFNPLDLELHGFEAAIRSTDGQVFVISTSVVEGGVNSLSGQEFAVSFGSPLAMAPVTILATFQILPIHPDECVILTGVSAPSLESELPLIWPTPDLPRPIETNNLFDNGVDAVVSGWINPIAYGHYPPPCSGAVSVSASSWGSLKSLYR